MPKWFKAVCLKEIYWKGKTYRQHDKINVIEEDVQILSSAGVLGDIKKIEIEANVETATREAPENAVLQYRKKGRR